MKLDFTPGSVGYVQIRHDPWCRAQYTQRASDCVCNAEVVVVTEQTFIEGIERMNRAQRRAAERAKRRGR